MNKSYLILGFLFFACGQPFPSAPNYQLLPTVEIRYQESSRQLRAIVQLRQGDSLPVSTIYNVPAGGVSFLGSPMQLRPANASTENRWQDRRDIVWPAELYFSIPKPDFKTGDERQTFQLAMSPPSLDSLPAQIDRSTGARFQFGTEPLAANESLLLFFETTDWNPGVKRILVAGPTTTPYVNLPATAISELPAGPYEFYYVKQQLSRDSLPGLAASTQIEYFTNSKMVEIQ